MASSDDIAEDSVSSVLIDSLKAYQNGDALSPEEIAWVDSCLVKDPDILGNDWSSVKDALIEILGFQPQSPKSLAPGSDGLSEGTDVEMLPSTKPGTVKHSEMTNDDSVQTNEEMEESNDDFPIKETGISSSEDFQGYLSESSLRNAFLPHYREDTGNVDESVDSGLDTGSSTYEMEPLSQDIFKVWDLGIPSEEDELVKELKKALSESSAEPVPPIADDSRAWRNLKDESVDHLIAGISDLSLDQHSK